jgi:hypothetical protein
MEESISGQRGVRVGPYAVYQVMRTSLAVELLRCPCLWHCLGKRLYLLRSAKRYISHWHANLARAHARGCETVPCCLRDDRGKESVCRAKTARHRR